MRHDMRIRARPRARGGPPPQAGRDLTTFSPTACRGQKCPVFSVWGGGRSQKLGFPPKPARGKGDLARFGDRMQPHAARMHPGLAQTSSPEGLKHRSRKMQALARPASCTPPPPSVHVKAGVQARLAPRRVVTSRRGRQVAVPVRDAA